MAILAKFDVTGMDAAGYDAVIRQLAEMGQGAPDGRLYHVCYGDRQRLQVIDIYESAAQLDAFGAKLGPLLQSMGVTAQPEVSEVYNIIAGG